MRDAIAHPVSDFAATAVARELAARLDLRRLELPRPRAAASLDAALAVAPVGLRLYRAPPIPVVVLTPAAAASPPLRGSSVVCGVDDDADAAGVAIAGALAERLGFLLVLVHVWSKDDRRDGRETVARVARAAGLDRPESVPVRLVRGAAGRTIAATARREGATLVVMCESATGYLVRRCEHPVLVRPRNPAAARRLREALAPVGNAQAWRS